jgi:hypothetical protein
VNNFCNINFLSNSQSPKSIYAFKIMINNALPGASRWQNSPGNLQEKKSKNKVFGIILKISVRRKMFDKSSRKSGMT